MPRVAGVPGLEKVEWEWGACFGSDSRKSFVRMHMHEGCMNRSILDDFLLSLTYGNYFQLMNEKSKFYAHHLIDMHPSWCMSILGAGDRLY